jgi:hypothetical protein
VPRLPLLLALLLACGGDAPPSKPSPEAFEAATAIERCELTEPRAARCADELVVEGMRDLLGDDPLVDQTAAEIRASKPSRRQRRDIHATSCHADPIYAAAVLACWDERDCTAFARCVVSRRAPSPPR